MYLENKKNPPGRQFSDEIEGDENTILIRRTMRSGQKFYYDGNVVVLGDVNPGAEVVATGNVIVMGQMRGVVHAGADGDESAMVMAFRLLPTQLRIANHITRPPDDEVHSSTRPEIARIKNGVVTIESYHTGAERVFR
ncbi:MAG: septum site-determining protein MinC [Bacillota bacterium]